MTSSFRSLPYVIWLTSICYKVVCAAPVTSDWLNEDQIKRCRGIPCEKWDAIQNKLAALKETNKKHKDPSVDLLLDVKHQESENTIDGDIWPTMDVLETIEEKLRTRHKRKLAIFSDTIKRWDVPIHYYIDSSFNSTQADAIRGAVRHWEAQTCIRFKEQDFYGATLRQIFAEPFLYFVKNNKCGTFVGRVPDAIAQQIYLSDQCIYQWGAIVHEIGHIVGFWHEHQRSDRDGYITLFLDRMAPPVDYSQYDEEKTRNLVPYDYGSVMHYWAWSSSPSLSKITIEPKDLRYLYTIGQKVQLSFLDARLANIEYCSDKCSDALTCSNQGYQDPNNCTRCKCPDGFVGDHCERLAPSEKAECGGVIILGKELGKEKTYISSPGYNDNITYKDYTSCTWLIKAPENQKVNLLFMNNKSDHFGMFCQYPVCFHWVEIKMSADKSITGPRFCCENLNKIRALPGVLTSDGRQMIVLMRSNFTTSQDGSSPHNNGFRALIWTSPENKTQQADETKTKHPVGLPISGSKYLVPELNIVFVMDSSGSVGADNWNKIKNFAKGVIYHLDAYNFDYQLGFVTFGSSGYVNIHLDRHFDYQVISKLIDSLPWKMESSNIADGIRKARQEIVSGRSNDVPSLVVLVTDGPASAEQANTETEARMLKTMANTKLSVIGLTRKVNRAEIMSLASQPADKYVRMSDSFEGLNDIVNHVTEVAKELREPRVYRDKPSATTTTRTPNTTTEITTTSQVTTETLPDTSAKSSPTKETPTGTKTSKSKPSTTTKSSTVKPSTTTRSLTVKPSTQSAQFMWQCNFEDERTPFCDMNQEQHRDQFEWTRHSGPTQSSDTGPYSAADGKYYIYIEASRPRKPNDAATIYIPEVPREGEYCLRYYYNMYGYHIKELKINIIESNGKLILLRTKTKLGDVGSTKWIKESVGVYLNKKSKIGFTGVRGSEYSGDIALDNISLFSGPCT